MLEVCNTCYYCDDCTYKDEMAEALDGKPEAENSEVLCAMYRTKAPEARLEESQLWEYGGPADLWQGDI